MEKINEKLFAGLNPEESRKINGGYAYLEDDYSLNPYNTYATSGAGGATPPAGQPSDTNDLSTSKTGGDWKNL